ncbi:MAG: hypothetical protein LBJ64_00190 [Deltaproteobacteria bacterium]|nr:hypothetical protein [Deltaproteobacteria bacterium]
MTNDVDSIIDASQLSQTNEYYIDATHTLIFKAFKVLILLGLIAWITWWGPWDLYDIILVLIISFYVLADIYHTIRNLSRPFITLGASHFVVGQPSVVIPYSWVECFAFDQSRQSNFGVSFSLLPRAEASLPKKIEGGGPVSLKDGRIVCKNTIPGRGFSAADFFADLGARLKAAGATDAFSDQNSVVNV